MTACVTHRGDETEAQAGLLCWDCFDRLRKTLVQLPAIATWLEVNIAATGNPNGERVSGTSEDPIPLRPDVLDLIGPDSRKYAVTDESQIPYFLLWEDGLVIGSFASWREALQARWDEIVASDDLDPVVSRWRIAVTERGGYDQRGEDSFHNTLITWAKLVAEEGPFAWTDRNDTTGLVSWLAGHLSWIAGQPWVDEFAADVHKLASDAHRVVPWRPEQRAAEDPCATCGVRAVVINLGDGYRQCEKRAGGCGKRETLSEYELRVLLPEARRSA